jgi:cation diffusion facilitator CzcD-associated flavoprotein CzcO
MDADGSDSPAGLPGHADVVVVGAGFAGLCAAIKLRAAGHEVLVLEKDGDVGGTWLVNTYPGCACDVPSLVYSYSFAQNPDWQSAYSPQPQILAYLQGIARDYDLRRLIRFGVELRSATWDSGSQRWALRTSAGDLTATTVVAATGGLSAPSIPAIPGADLFAGPTWHSAQWRHDIDLTGKRVAVVGTGASAIQFVPHVQRTAGRLTLFQRTPPWIMPRHDRPFSAREKRLHRNVPGLQRLRRTTTYLAIESRIIGFTKRPQLLALAERVALKHLQSQVPDPQLRAALTPDFRLGCKRVLMSNDYYPALAADNSDVVTDRIVDITEAGIVTVAADGTRHEHEADALICGTGFQTVDPPIARIVTGRAGRTLSETWVAAGMQALRGTAIHGFPNFFMLVGPNTGLAHNSIVLMIEAQVGYLVDLLRTARHAGRAVLEASAVAQQRYNDRLQHELATTVWNTGGCTSWYLDEHGRNTTLWPGSTVRFIREMRTADLAEYDDPLATAGSDDPGRTDETRPEKVRA